MHIDIVMLNIVIALGIIGLIARAADGRGRDRPEQSIRAS